MNLQEFAHFHLPALEADEIRFNVQIAALTAAVAGTPAGLAYWTLGAPGHCAIRSPGRAILLGKLDKAECQKLAQDTISDASPGVVGADDTTHWFSPYARVHGGQFRSADPAAHPRSRRATALSRCGRRYKAGDSRGCAPPL